MKYLSYCQKCEKEVKPVEDQPDDIRENANFTCQTCNSVVDKPSPIPFTLEEAVHAVKCLKNGKPHDESTRVNMRIGEVKRCDNCNTITDVVGYTGCLPADSNFSTSCIDCDCDDEMENCDCDCNIEKAIKQSNETDAFYRQVRDIINQVCDVDPPVSDSMLEFDKMLWYVQNMHPDINKSTQDYSNAVEYAFLPKCAELGILRA